jgi:hypothetical protein
VTRGQTVRGIYSDYHPPGMLGLQWTFAVDGDVPMPFDEIETIVRFRPTAGATAVIITQPSDSREHADFFEIAWSDRLANLRFLLEARA